MADIPGVERVAVGPVLLHWLAPERPLTQAELAAGTHPDEWALASAMRAPVRRAEYLRARWLLRRLTGYNGPLPRSPVGGPTWPPGVTGSLTHKDGYVGLALAPAAHWVGLGVDAEDLARVREAFEPRLCGESERALLGDLARRYGEGRAHWLGVLFSFKEALFKCHHPLGGRMFFFLDAEVTHLDPASGTISARVLVATSPQTPAHHVSHGHFRLQAALGRRFVLTSVTLPPLSAPCSPAESGPPGGPGPAAGAP